MSIDTSPPKKRLNTLAAFGGTPVTNDFIPPIVVTLEDDEIDAAVQVLRSGQVRQGKECSAFESEFAEISSAHHALTTCNGTTALQMAYEALIKPGDEVLCPGFTFIATASMILARGAIPIFCDVLPDTFTIDPVDAARRITARTTAITPVHLYGNVADIHAIQTLATEHKLAVIYDAAQAHLAKYAGRGIGAYGNACTYSFYPTKNMTTGEGGMVTVNDATLARRLMLLRDHGMEPGQRYHHVALGYNYRLNDIAAALGRVQLRKLSARTAQRQAQAARLTALLADTPNITCPTATKNAKHVYHQYTIRLHVEAMRCTRDEFSEYLKAEGVGSAVHYPSALTAQPIIQELVENLPALPECERAGREVLCLPMHHGLTDEQVEFSAAAVRKIAEAVAK